MVDEQAIEDVRRPQKKEKHNEKEDVEISTLLKQEADYYDFKLFKHLQPSPFTPPELREDAKNFRNLLDVPFKEFMAAHGIHPKVFMLKRDYDNTIKPAREITPNRPHIANRKFMTATNAPEDFSPIKVSSLTMDRGTSVKVTEKNVRFAQ
jgi:hypothetical protein